MQFISYVVREKSSGLYASVAYDSYGDSQYVFDINERDIHTAIQDGSLYMSENPEFYETFNIKDFSNYEKIEIKLNINQTDRAPIKHIYTKIAIAGFEDSTYFLTLGGHYPKQDQYRFVWSDGRSEAHCHRDLEYVKSLNWIPLKGFTQQDIDDILC